MKFIILFIVFAFYCIPLHAQCNYVWQSSDGALQTSNYLYSPKIKFDSLNLLLSKVIDNIKIIRIDDKSAEWVDSFITGGISDTTYLNYIGKAFFARGSNEWWLNITYNNVGYLLTRLDTIKIENKDIYIYKLSTDLTTSFWNEDFDNWVFYYCREFGIVKYLNNFISELNIGEKYILADKSCSQEKQIFKIVKQKYNFGLEKKEQ